MGSRPAYSTGPIRPGSRCTSRPIRPIGFEEDGAIWCVNIVETNKQLARPLKRRLEQTSARVFTSGMLNEEVASLGEFDRLSDHPFVAFLEPPSLDARIVNQVGLFSVMSDPSLALDQWLPEEKRRLSARSSFPLS